MIWCRNRHDQQGGPVPDPYPITGTSHPRRHALPRDLADALASAPLAASCGNSLTDPSRDHILYLTAETCALYGYQRAAPKQRRLALRAG